MDTQQSQQDLQKESRAKVEKLFKYTIIPLLVNQVPARGQLSLEFNSFGLLLTVHYDLKNVKIPGIQPYHIKVTSRGLLKVVDAMIKIDLDIFEQYLTEKGVLYQKTVVSHLARYNSSFPVFMLSKK